MFLPVFLKSRKRVLQREPSSKYTYPYSIAATVQLSLEYIRKMKNGEQAIQLLFFLVFLNPDEIPISHLRISSRGLRGQLKTIFEEELLFYEALETLVQFSVVKRSQNKRSLAIHRLVQAVVNE